MTFPSLANNSLSVLQKRHLPAGQLGLHISRLSIVWNVPPYLLAVACAWLVDRAAVLPDSAFYRTYLWLYVATGILQLPACLAIIGVGSDPGADKETAYKGMGAILEPFGDAGYRGLLLVSLASGLVSTMFVSFVNPYLMQAKGLSTTAITVVDAVVSIGMLLLLPLWGRMTDRYGSRNILYLCTLGIALGALLLAGGGLIPFLLSSLFAWRGAQGILASGKGVAGQALLLTKSVREKAGSYIAAASFAGGVGGFLGSVSGGALLEWLAERPQLGQNSGHYRIYFGLVGLAHLLLAGLVFTVDDGQPRLSPTGLLWQAFRGARRRIGQSSQ